MGKKSLLALSLLLTALLSIYFAAQVYATYILKQKFDRRLSKLPVSSSYERFSYDLLKNDIKVSNLTISSGEVRVSVDELTLDLPFTLREKKLPSSLSVKLRGVSIPASLPFISEFLRSVGYGKQLLHFNLYFGYRLLEDRLKAEVAASAPHLGDIFSTASFKGIEKGLLEAFLEGRVPLSSLEKRIALEDFSLRYVDGGLIKGFMEELSSQEGRSLTEIKSELASMVKQSLAENPLLYERLGKALVAFVENPSCIEVRISPRPPLKISEIERFLKEKPQIDRMVELLNLTATPCRP
jgi:hypothetical protein